MFVDRTKWRKHCWGRLLLSSNSHHHHRWQVIFYQVRHSQCNQFIKTLAKFIWLLPNACSICIKSYFNWDRCHFLLIDAAVSFRKLWEFPFPWGIYDYKNSPVWSLMSLSSFSSFHLDLGIHWVYKLDVCLLLVVHPSSSGPGLNHVIYWSSSVFFLLAFL